ncbi:MAG: type II secretion system protein [Planctomycetes bacterium]|nr:type II secretion system protein [Planctomycetota bacterium]MCP4772306.1 type II secretion system protein [Planctomycetota bacterium]MCP4861594.1 type II secretion system protein [Planctomycetota bacterium]
MKNRANGFTLLELMIVLVIIGVLSAVFVGFGGNIFGDSKTKAAQAKLRSLEAMIREYRNIEGEYPDDRLMKGVAMNAKNANAEALFLALFDSKYTGSRPSQEWLVNTDGDEANRDLTMLGTRALFEIGDEWGNPILYFESLHYADENGCVALAGEDDYFEEDVVFAQRSSVTNSFHEPNDFQLISAGPDGYFNTDDDLYSFTD